MSCQKYAAAFLSLAISAGILGCGGDTIGRNAVTGTVTMDGAPLDYGAINFLPDAGNSAQVGAGAVIENGEYSIPREQGLPPGKYRVAITSPSGGAPSEPDKGLTAEQAMNQATVASKEQLPPKYNTETELTAEVSAGSAPLQFDYKVESIKE